MNAAKLRLAVFKFASCDGCQLALLNAEDELLPLCDRFDIAHFAEASSRLEAGPYDVTVVEGSITTPEDAKRIIEIRAQSRFLMTIGACATAGGIQALRHWGNRDEWIAAVYARPEYVVTLAESTPIAEHVPVDFELRGCPVDRDQLVATLLALADGRRPRTPSHSVCLDCKRRGNVCVVVARGIPCLGPVTQSGCGALCPTYDRGCYGCFGPSKPADVDSLARRLVQLGNSAEELIPLLRNVNATAPEFRDASDRLERTLGEGASS